MKKYLVGAVFALGMVAGNTAFASVIGPFDKENGAAAEIGAALSQLDAAGADVTDVLALGKFDVSSNAFNDSYGLGLEATISDQVFDGGELKGFDFAADAVDGYSIFAVLIKAGQEHIIYFDNMFDDMNTALLGNKEVSHISYFGTAATPVPLPAAGWMLLAGLGGLGAIKRRKTA